MEISDKIQKYLDNNEFVGTLLLDLAKAFDTVDTDILLNKLFYYGIKGNNNKTLDWFSSYLKGRKQSVSINNHTSSLKNIYYGVPQGSVLGPILFLLYINDLHTCSDVLKFRLFADDTFIFLQNTDLFLLQYTMNYELQKVADWMRANKLTVNTMKTKSIIFHPKRKSINRGSYFSFNNYPIENEAYVKYLGITIDEKLTWKHHLLNVRIKLSKALGILYKIRNHCPPSTLRQLYFSLIYPHLQYGIMSWGCVSDYQLKPLQTLQNKILRCITHSKFDQHANTLYNRLNLLKIRDIFLLQYSLFMYKYYHSQLPIMFNNYFSPIVHDYSTRYATANYSIPQFKTQYGLRSPTSFCLHIWSIYNQDIYMLPYNDFKKTVSALFRFDYD